MGRTRDKREKQLGTGVSTRLVFMPDKTRDIRKPLDVTKEAMVAHHARLFTLPQFAVLAAELLKARGPFPLPLAGLLMGSKSLLSLSPSRPSPVPLLVVLTYGKSATSEAVASSSKE